MKGRAYLPEIDGENGETSETRASVFVEVRPPTLTTYELNNSLLVSPVTRGSIEAPSTRHDDHAPCQSHTRS